MKNLNDIIFISIKNILKYRNKSNIRCVGSWHRKLYQGPNIVKEELT